MKFIFLAAALLVGGCAPHTPQMLHTPLVEGPSNFTHSLGGVTIPRAWWTTFNDASLNSAVEEAFTQNLDLKRAWARLAQAHALATVQGAADVPAIDLNASGTRSKQTFAGSPSNWSNRFNLGVGLQWELDLWKRLENLTTAATFDVNASAADVESTGDLLAGTVVRLWFLIAEQEALLRVLAEQLASSREQLELAELRFGVGLGHALTVLQQRLQVAQLETETPRVELALSTTNTQLDVVLGRAPSVATHRASHATLSAMPPFPTLPSPRELLVRRADLRAAHARVAAADHRVAAAIADTLPSIRLSLDAGFASPELSSLFSNTAGSLAGNLLQPLFDGGRRGAEVDRRRAMLEEATLSFSALYLTAMREVVDAIERERTLITLAAQLESQVTLARTTLDEARLRFANGQTEYLDVLSALGSLQRVQREYVSVQGDLFANRADLFIAIGRSQPTSIAGTPSL